MHNVIVQDDIYMHNHDCYEIEFILSGNGYMRINNFELECKKGTITLINPSEYHMYYGITAPLEIYSVQFLSNFIPAYIINIIDAQSEPLYDFFADSKFNMTNELFSMINLNFGSECSLSNAEIYGCIILICTMLLKKYDSRNDALANINSSKYNLALSYINTHYHGRISSATVAKYINMSTGYFSAYFKAHAGIPFDKYIQQLRLKDAYDSIINTALPLKAICLNVGYHSFPSFSKAFKEEYGCSPNVLRTSLKAGRPNAD